MNNKIHPLQIGTDEFGFPVVLCLEVLFIPSDQYYKRGAFYLKQILNDAFGWNMTSEGFLWLMEQAGYKVRGDRVMCKVSKKFSCIPQYLRGLG